MLGIRIGKVFKVNYAVNTVDVMLDAGLGVIRDIPVMVSLASTSTGVFELPALNTVEKRSGNVVSLVDGSLRSEDNLYHLENTVPGKIGLDDTSTNYAYAIVAGMDEGFGKNNPVCIGFLYPHRNQILFDPDNIDSSLAQPIQDAIRQLKGALFHRTNSDVYWIVDANGNFEWTHPNGSFFRMAESPTQEDDGMIHIDLSGKNKRAKNNGTDTNIKWDTSIKAGVDGTANSSRKLYGHLEVVTEQGTVIVDINKKTGNVTIQTPSDVSDATDKTKNQITIICGGNATIESVAGDVRIQALQGQVNIESDTTITQLTDSAGNGSISIGNNGDNGSKHLAFLENLMQKFNTHKHNIPNGITSAPDKQFDDSDGTFVTEAG